jgi:hypothetical protein
MVQQNDQLEVLIMYFYNCDPIEIIVEYFNCKYSKEAINNLINMVKNDDTLLTNILSNL